MNISRIIGSGFVLGALFLSSCDPAWHADYVYAGGGYGGSYASVGWTNARYDNLGYPIYGYWNGSPVYGYSSAGLPIFSFAALTSYCYVPSWGPASWYSGSWRYPRHIHRRPQPPRYPQEHRPGSRPQANHPNNLPPNKRPGYRPGSSQRPGAVQPGHGNNHAGQHGNRPGQQSHQPNGNKPGNGRPHSSQPNSSNNWPHAGNLPMGPGPAMLPGSSRPSRNGSAAGQNRPQSSNSPSGNARPNRLNRPGNATTLPSSRPSFSRPSGSSEQAARPAAPSSSNAHAPSRSNRPSGATPSGNRHGGSHEQRERR